MARGFTVQDVEIEGFKGFASSQSVDFKGRHVFLLGGNGNGKSSIVEAVRWGLFGSAFRRNEIVKNQHYSGDCIVTVKLMRDGQLWTLRRELNLGTGSTSEATLTDQNGKIHRIREIMPLLDSVDAGEGTHIIFAPQSAPLSKQPEDLEPFERTVFNYLGLTHPQALLSNIRDFLEDQTGVEHELDEQLADSRKALDGQILEEQTRRNHIQNAPPWPGGRTPSIASSEQKAHRFIEGVTGNPLASNFQGLSLDALIEVAEQTLRERLDQNAGTLEEEKIELAVARERLANVRDIQAQIVTQRSMIQNTQAKMETQFAGVTSVDLRENLAAAKHEATTESIKGRIVRDAIDLIDRDASENFPCPICDAHHDKQTLESALKSAANQSADPINSKVTRLESQLHECEELENLLNGQEEHLRLLTDKAVIVTSLVSDEDKNTLDATNDIDHLIEVYYKKESVIAAQLEDQETWAASEQAELNRLKEEGRFHRIQTRLSNLQSNRTELQRVIEAYNSLVAFGESVRTIRGVVDAQLSERLAQEIPRVSDILSRSFSALTQHPWYDRLTISEATLPNLELRVASSQDPSSREDPTGVLNGQAESALKLVPYFAFGQTDDAPTEVYLVMLDDPTRALDTEHTRILLESLQELGQNVQLIVASQETERFQEMIPAVFDLESYVIIEPTGWSPVGGPNLNVKYG